jgi:polysaccharide biosynthesis transport protein
MTGPSFAAPATTPAAPAAPKSPPRPKPGDKSDDAGGMRVLTYLRLHWLMICFCGALIGGAGALAAWELLASKYESYAMLQVTSVPTPIGNQGPAHQARTDFSTYVKTTATLIKSEFVLNAALRDIKDLSSIKNQQDPIKYLEEELMVSWQDGSEVIRITCKSAEPQDAKRIVDAVQKAFMSEVIQKDVDEKKALLNKIKDEQASMRKVLLDATGDKSKPGTITPAGGPVTPTAPGAAPPGMLPQDIIIKHDPRILITRIVQLQDQVERLPLTINDYKRKHLLLSDKLELLKKAPIPQVTLDMVDRDPELITQKLRMIRAKSDWKFREGTSTDPNAPGVLEFKAVYEAQEKRYEEMRQEKIHTLDGAKRLETASRLAAELEELIRTIQRHEEQLDAAKKQLKTAEAQLAQLPLPAEKSGSGGILPARFEKEYKVEDTVLIGVDSIFAALVRQQYLLQMELNSPPRVRILQAASHPVQKDMKKQVMGTVFAGLMGFVLMAAGVIGYEMLCRRVSSLADVKASVPAPIVGVIPCEPNEAMGRDPVKRAAANEAIDKLRAYVSQTWLSRGATTIAVTSPIGDEGKAFAAFGLASSLAQAGYKTLLVDFDLREPALHTYAGVANLAGVCELLRAETDMRSSVQFLPSGLHLLPAGKWSDEARKAATGEKLENLMARMKEPYDCVVLHGHALLTVAESVEVARRCEVVLVCARYRETSTPLLKKAAERVATMEIPFSGVVYVGATEQEALC